MNLSVLGIGLLAPGLLRWEEGRAILAGRRRYEKEPAPDPAALILPPNERRRSSEMVRWAMCVAQEAIERARLDPRDVATVFTSSGGETGVLDQLCTSLSAPHRTLSPTLFHQSVHNTAAGYWGIATACRQSSTALSCYDFSFIGGLMEAAAFVRLEKRSILLVAYDLPPPAPLYAARPIEIGFAVALVLSCVPSSSSQADLSLTLSNDVSRPASRMEQPELEHLRVMNPAARSLPLLAAIAMQSSGTVRLDLFEEQQVCVEVSPCR